MTAAATVAVLPAKMLVEAPVSDSNYEYTTLGYVEAYDAPNNDDYAFVAYKDTPKSNPAGWCVRIKGHRTAGAVFEQEAMRLNARSDGAQGKPYFVWGFNMTPSAGDCRCVEFRVHVAGGKPASIEMVLVTRNADGSNGGVGENKSVQFPWPA